VLLSQEEVLGITQFYTNPSGVESDPMRLTIGSTDFSASLHMRDQMLLIELEAFVELLWEPSRIVTRVLGKLQAATALETLFDISVHEIPPPQGDSPTRCGQQFAAAVLPSCVGGSTTQLKGRAGSLTVGRVPGRRRRTPEIIRCHRSHPVMFQQKVNE
jgi:hypothetical protein